MNPDSIAALKRAALPPMTREEERDLFAALRAGDETVRDRIVRSVIVLVIARAVTIRYRGLDLDDRIGFGFVGLQAAISKFDPDRGVRFTTMAIPWIDQAIRRACQNHARPIRIPVWRQDAGLPEDYPRVIASLDQPAVSGEPDASTLGDFRADPAAVNPEQAAVDRITIDRLLGDLSDRDREILTRVAEGETHAEIAVAVGCARPTVYNRERAALRRLRSPPRTPEARTESARKAWATRRARAAARAS